MNDDHKPKQDSRHKFTLFLVLSLLIFVSLACSISGQSDLKGTQAALDIQSTRAALKLTELAEVSSNLQEQEKSPQSPSITPSQTLHPTDTADNTITSDAVSPTTTQTSVVIQPLTITPTSTLENQAGPGFVQYSDDFSDSTSGWDIQESGNNQWGYKNNHYQIKVGDPYLRVVALYPYKMSMGSIQTTVIVTQVQPQASYGVVCRYQDVDNYYYFEIASDGTYLIGRRLNGEWTLLNGVQGATNSAIKSTGYNFIFATFASDELSLYVNGVLIDTVYDNALREGYVGLSASTGEFSGFEVSFDQFTAQDG